MTSQVIIMPTYHSCGQLWEIEEVAHLLFLTEEMPHKAEIWNHKLENVQLKCQIWHIR